MVAKSRGSTDISLSSNYILKRLKKRKQRSVPTNLNNSLDPSQLPIIAKAVGLDETAFNTCLTSGKYTNFIQKSVEEAIKAGALGTPYSVIITKDGRKVVINGAEPLTSVKIKI